MAKYEIKMSCGHTETIQLFGKMTDRDKKIAWLEEHGICTACYKARIAAAHDAETTAAAAKAEEENLPEINGSEKQIAWALSIRAKKFEALNEMFANANANATDEQRQQNQIALQAAKNVLSRKTQSRFWIDNRNTHESKLITANNLQDELKEEFARLNAEVERNEVLSTPTVTTAAQDIAVAAEIELATANNTADNITNDEHEQEAITMTITTTTNKAGKISGYYVDGVKTRKADIDFIINRRHDEIIVVDYYVGTEFKSLTRSPYQLKVVFTGTEHPIMTQAAADELGYKIVKAFSGSYNGTTFIVAKQADVDIAINNTTTTDVDDDDNDDDDAFALLPELDELNDVSDIAPVIQPLRQTFAFTPVGNEQHQILTSGDVVTFRNGKLHHITSTKYAAWFSAYFCHYAWHIFKDGKVDGVNGTNDDEEFFAEMAKRGACTIDEPEPPVDDDDNDDDDVFDLLPELDELNDVSEPITAKEEVVNAYGKTFSFINIGGERVSFINGEVHIISSDKYDAHFNRQTGKYVAAIVEDGNYKAKTLDTDEEFFAEMAKRGACTIDDPEPPVDDFGAKLAELQAKRDAAQATLLKAQEAHETAEHTLQKFLSDTAGNLATKLQSLKLDYSIKLVTKNGYSWTVTDFDNIYVDAFDGGKIFAFTDWRNRKYARYDTPAQVDKVIDRLRAAIERGDKEFKFPTVDELNQPPIDTDLERKIELEDSLRRAMEIAYAEHERFLRLAATSYNKGTRSDCFREAANELTLYNICWQATNELWSERW